MKGVDLLRKIVPEEVREGVRRSSAAMRYHAVMLTRRHRLPHILSDEETIRRIIDEGLSVARYGDGEINAMYGIGNGFCHPTPRLGQRLREVINDHPSKLLICFPISLRSMRGKKQYFRYFWHLHLSRTIDRWLEALPDEEIGDSLATRFYMDNRSPARARRLAELWKELWRGRDLLIVEGEGSRLGVGNDLFDGAASIERIICPACDAFERYDEILRLSLEHSPGRLVLIALGQTATVLACDLARHGRQAVDIGHIDIEYEWMRMGAEQKVAVPSKATNEVGGTDYGDIDSPLYLSQIIARI